MNREIFVKNKYYINIVFVVLNILALIFIFSRSLATEEISKNESGAATGLLNFLFPFDLSENFVRKLAHFVEFAGLGVITALMVFSFYRKAFKGTFVMLFITLMSAVIDEYIQLDVQGRSGQVSDVVLDFSGSITGVIITSALLAVAVCIRRKKKQRVIQNSVK